MPIKVILDSNFLMLPAQLQIDIFKEMENLLDRKVDPIILLPTYKELEKISLNIELKEAREARVALEMAKKCRIIDVITEENESVDEQIVRAAKKLKCAVATNDRELRRKLRMLKVPVLYLRQRAHLSLDGSIL